jgi:hypothetical protein
MSLDSSVTQQFREMTQIKNIYLIDLMIEVQYGSKKTTADIQDAKLVLVWAVE